MKGTDIWERIIGFLKISVKHKFLCSQISSRAIAVPDKSAQGYPKSTVYIPQW